MATRLARLIAIWPALGPMHRDAWRNQRYTTYGRRVPFLSALSALIFASFALSDQVTIPDIYSFALAVRFAVVCPLLLSVWLVQGLVARYSLNPILVEAYYCAAAVLAMTSLSVFQILTYAPSAQSYFIGVFPVMFYFVVAAWTRSWMAVGAIVAMGVIAIIGVKEAYVVPAAIASDASLTITACSLIAVLLVLRREVDGRRNFLLQISLTELSEVDALTGLPNRRALTSTLHRWDTNGSRGLIAMIDIDHFKRFNDTHGHSAGDTCLREVSRTLGTLLRRQDDAQIARYGGEEFVLVVPGLDEEAAGQLLERLRYGVQESRPMGVLVTISIGWSWSPRRQICDSAAMLRAADEGVYRAKAAGRNQAIQGRTPAAGGLAGSSDVR